MAKKLKKQTGRDRANEMLKFVFELQAADSGVADKLAKKLTERTGRAVQRQQVNEWLASDPDKRVEPKLGIGTMLIDAARDLILEGKILKPEAKPAKK